ncbi:MAG: Wzz/FepE/Etk N-terminal domain-containing protein [Steroidobacteraceae bacterium]
MLPAHLAQSAISWAQFAALLRAHRRHAIMIAVVLLVATIVTVKLLPKSYTAEATVLVNFETNEDTRQAPAELFASYLLTQVDLLQSRGVLLSVIDRLGLTKDPEFYEGFKSDGVSSLKDWVEKQVRSDLTVEQGKGTQLLRVAFTSRDRNKAAQIANAIVEAYQATQSGHESDPGSERALQYNEQLTDLKNKVSAAQQRMAEFRQRTGITDINSQTDVETQALAALEQQLLVAENARRTAESTNNGNEGSSNQVMASQLVQNLKAQISTLQGQLAELSATLGPQHPKVLELQSQIASSRRALEHEIETFSQNSSAQVTNSAQLEAKLRRAVDDQRAKLVSIRQLQDQGQKLELELESAQTVYKRALDSYDKSIFASASLVGRASPPLQASKPNKALLAVIGAFLAIALGVGLPIGYELLFDRRLHCRDDVERDFGLPVLAEFDALPLASRFT